MSDSVGPNNRPEPVILRADNFTPPTRTPWGGTRLMAKYKAGLGLQTSVETVVGESWELSVSPEFPSKTQNGESLRSLIASNTEAWLGKEFDRDSTALLVKWIDTADNLSVQIHPTDGYEALKGKESGKPECWYIVEADEGAGVYLGLREHASVEAMRSAIDNDANVSELLHFVPVQSGDFFLIDAGTPHAIGKGLTLVEPQRVLPERVGVTYRYWDWNRRYDNGGSLHDKGEPRELHVEDALAVTAWDRPRGEALIGHVRHRASGASTNADASIESLSGSGSPLPWSVFFVDRITGNGTVQAHDRTRLQALVVIEGSVGVLHEGGKLQVRAGQSAVLPACLGAAELDLNEAHALLCAVA